jgi:hypothetical protein
MNPTLESSNHHRIWFDRTHYSSVPQEMAQEFDEVFDKASQVFKDMILTDSIDDGPVREFVDIDPDNYRVCIRRRPEWDSGDTIHDVIAELARIRDTAGAKGAVPEVEFQFMSKTFVWMWWQPMTIEEITAFENLRAVHAKALVLAGELRQQEEENRAAERLRRAGYTVLKNISGRA